LLTWKWLGVKSPGTMDGIGAGSQIIGVLDGVGVAVLVGGSGSQIMGVLVGGGVAVREGGGGGSQIMGVVVGGGCGSHTIGPEQTRVPPYRMIMARMAFCKSLGSMSQGTMFASS
jgi:hypothetical protein